MGGQASISNVKEQFTHPLKKGLDKKINIRLLTPVFIIIYQAEHNLWCPGNVGWGNFA